MELHTEYKGQTINELCELFGKTKQAYYQRIKYNYQEVVRDDILLQMVKEERKYMPRIGGRKLLYLINKQLPDDMQMGRDSFFDWLGSNNLLVRRTRTRVITTNSFHWLRKYPNLIKEYIPTRPNQLWVSDITYIRTIEGVLFLYLITDAFSKKIVGWKVSHNLKAYNAIDALNMAIKRNPNRSQNIIHHSDRGVQYCSGPYVKVLTKNNIRISMTQDGNPLDNAIAERINGILKTEWLNDLKIKNKRSAITYLSQIIEIYNQRRPHLSLNMLTPNEVHHSKNIIETPIRLWKNYYKDYYTQCSAGT